MEQHVADHFAQGRTARIAVRDRLVPRLPQPLAEEVDLG